MRFRERHQDPDRHRHRICRAHQQFRLGRRLHRGAFGLALVRLDGGLRRRTAVPLPDGRALAADRGAEISAPAHRHAEAHRRSRRLLRLHLFGARRRRLPDVRHHADADLRSHARRSAISATSWSCSGRATSSNGSRSTRDAYRRRCGRRRGRSLRAADARRDLFARPNSNATSTATTASWRRRSMAH